MNFSHFFIRRPIFAAVLSIVIVLGGFVLGFVGAIMGLPG
jgi:multidrug efflux pump subunit AcrB